MGVPTRTARDRIPKNVPIRAPSLLVGEIWPTAAGPTEMKAPEHKPKIRKRSVWTKDISEGSKCERTIQARKDDNGDGAVCRKPERKTEYPRDGSTDIVDIHTPVAIRKVAAAVCADEEQDVDDQYSMRSVRLSKSEVAIHYASEERESVQHR